MDARGPSLDLARRRRIACERRRARHARRRLFTPALSPEGRGSEENPSPIGERQVRGLCIATGQACFCRSRSSPRIAKPWRGRTFLRGARLPLARESRKSAREPGAPRRSRVAGAHTRRSAFSCASRKTAPSPTRAGARLEISPFSWTLSSLLRSSVLHSRSLRCCVRRESRGRPPQVTMSRKARVFLNAPRRMRAPRKRACDTEPAPAASGLTDASVPVTRASQVAKPGARAGESLPNAPNGLAILALDLECQSQPGPSAEMRGSVTSCPRL